MKFTVIIFSKNRVLTAHAWSVSEKIIRYLKDMETDNKNVCSSGASQCNGNCSYWKENVQLKINCTRIPVFCNIQELVQSTQNRLSITVHKNNKNHIESLDFHKTCFMCVSFTTVKENQKQCVIMKDEIVIKKYCYIKGEFGLAEPIMIHNRLRKTVLALMITWWTHIYFYNVAHQKIQFVISL